MEAGGGFTATDEFDDLIGVKLTLKLLELVWFKVLG
jgi:hypothetical protein